MICANCKMANADDSRFCRECGIALSQGAIEPAPTTAAATPSAAAPTAADEQIGVAYKMAQMFAVALRTKSDQKIGGAAGAIAFALIMWAAYPNSAPWLIPAAVGTGVITYIGLSFFIIPILFPPVVRCPYQDCGRAIPASRSQPLRPCWPAVCPHCKRKLAVTPGN